MKVLALETCLAACSVALLDGDEVIARRIEPMTRGHQERLAPLVAELLASVRFDLSGLDRIGVTVGPGSFTGLRIGLAFAKGLGAALDKPVCGIGVLDALAWPHRVHEGLVLAVLEGPRDQVYLQTFQAGQSTCTPAAVPVELAVSWLKIQPSLMVGTGLEALASLPAGIARLQQGQIDPVDVARLAARAIPGDLKPLYLRAPDAKLPGGRDLPA